MIVQPWLSYTKKAIYETHSIETNQRSRLQRNRNMRERERERERDVPFVVSQRKCKPHLHLYLKRTNQITFETHRNHL